MRPFTLIDAENLDEAVAVLRQPGARVMAGGTDLLGVLKANVLPDYPQTIVDIHSIEGLDYIREDEQLLQIGALTRLVDVADSELVQRHYSVLAHAAGRTASPNLRNMGTIGGNICQFVRCWYMRGSDNYFHCIRKGGETCYADTGDNRYHSIFGGVNGCIAVNCSDLAPALIVLNARIVTTQRTLDAESFWAVTTPGSTALHEDELVTGIEIPRPPAGARSAFIKFTTRNTIGFPVVNCAALIDEQDARICLNAVHPMPYRPTKAEAMIRGKAITEELAEQAASAAVSDARPRELSTYKVQIAEALVKRTILACRPEGVAVEGHA